MLVGQNEICKVADFGLVRQIDEDCENYLSCSTTKIPIRWCAPECISERKFYPASDVWSYGVVLWEMENPSKLPYWQYDNLQVSIRVNDGERLDIPPLYPKTVQEIMLACWLKKPHKRPSFKYIAMLLTKLNF